MLYNFGRRVCRAFFRLFYRVKVHGIEHIPQEGPVILCSNHISLYDPPIIGIMVPRKVHYMAKDELFKIPLFGSLIRQLGAFPVKRGGISKDSIRRATQLLTDGNVLGIFPEGTRNGSRQSAGKGAANLALKTDAVVIPVAIVGPYRLFRQMNVVYGEPLDLTPFREGTSAGIEAATTKIMDTIYDIMSIKQSKL